MAGIKITFYLFDGLQQPLFLRLKASEKRGKQSLAWFLEIPNSLGEIVGKTKSKIRRKPSQGACKGSGTGR